MITAKSPVAVSSPPTALLGPPQLPITAFVDPCRQMSDLPTTRPSDFPEEDFWPASINCRQHANSRSDSKGPFSRNYLRHGLWLLKNSLAEIALKKRRA